MEASTIMLVMFTVIIRSYLESPLMWLVSWLMMLIRMVGRYVTMKILTSLFLICMLREAIQNK